MSVRTVREVQLWTKGIEWSHPSTMRSDSEANKMQTYLQAEKVHLPSGELKGLLMFLFSTKITLNRGHLNFSPILESAGIPKHNKTIFWGILRNFEEKHNSRFPGTLKLISTRFGCQNSLKQRWKCINYLSDLIKEKNCILSDKCLINVCFYF